MFARSQGRFDRLDFHFFFLDCLGPTAAPQTRQVSHDRCDTPGDDSRLSEIELNGCPNLLVYPEIYYLWKRRGLKDDCQAAS
ncbi:MAG: hypothetical protein A2289_13770 [Deltaproteobacteria bacterium RIFOXYA12_FULL_58_15]|nr:MAG: hypothetical protein A2289_13770 [Deltaproteobacteria bacterium RIFOXYA12_FULL_58_15]